MMGINQKMNFLGLLNLIICKLCRCQMLNRVLEQDGGEEADARSLSALQRLEGRQSCRLALRLRQDRGGQDEREPATADRADRARARARAVWQMGERSEDEDPQGQLLDSVFSVIIMLLDRTGRLRPVRIYCIVMTESNDANRSCS